MGILEEIPEEDVNLKIGVNELGTFYRSEEFTLFSGGRTRIKCTAGTMGRCEQWG